MEKTSHSEAFGKKLKYAREQKFSTQMEAALAIGCDNVAISLYESGKRMPDTPRLRRICEVYELNFRQMLNEADAIAE